MLLQQLLFTHLPGASQTPGRICLPLQRIRPAPGCYYKEDKKQSEAAIIFSVASVHRAQQGVPLPVSLTLVQHLYLAEHTAAAVTRSLLDDLEENITIYKYPAMQTCLPYMLHDGGEYMEEVTGDWR